MGLSGCTKCETSAISAEGEGQRGPLAQSGAKILTDAGLYVAVWKTFRVQGIVDVLAAWRDEGEPSARWSYSGCAAASTQEVLSRRRTPTQADAPGGSIEQTISSLKSSLPLQTFLTSASPLGGTTHLSPSAGKQLKMALENGL